MKETDWETRCVEVSCDNCGKDKFYDTTDYSEINNDLRYYGWIIRKVDGDWLDFCSKECMKDYLE